MPHGLLIMFVVASVIAMGLSPIFVAGKPRLVLRVYLVALTVAIVINAYAYSHLTSTHDHVELIAFWLYCGLPMTFVAGDCLEDHRQ
jgi:hypothetical protein